MKTRAHYFRLLALSKTSDTKLQVLGGLLKLPSGSTVHLRDSQSSVKSVMLIIAFVIRKEYK
jgi:hypothetical protein